MTTWFATCNYISQHQSQNLRGQYITMPSSRSWKTMLKSKSAHLKDNHPMENQHTQSEKRILGGETIAIPVLHWELSVCKGTIASQPFHSSWQPQSGWCVNQSHRDNCWCGRLQLILSRILAWVQPCASKRFFQRCSSHGSSQRINTSWKTDCPCRDNAPPWLPVISLNWSALRTTINNWRWWKEGRATLGETQTTSQERRR